MSGTHREKLLFPSAIDQNDFFRFALFDTFRVKKRWKPPVLFACLMSAFALICFTFLRSRSQASLLGGVLLGVGLILPAVWLLLYLSSVRKEAKELGLSKEKTAYEIALSDRGVRVTRGAETADYTWEKMFMAWRVKGGIYLYVLPARAFLMPEREESEAAWAIILRALPEVKRKDLR